MKKENRTWTECRSVLRAVALTGAMWLAALQAGADGWTGSEEMWGDGSLRRVEDVLRPLPPGAVTLTGGLEADLQRCIQHWQKETVPYPQLVEFFRSGHPQFALGEMWGKAVRSGAMFYRYRADEELRSILRSTLDDLLTTVRPNGSISCAPPEIQPENAGGDMWERKYVLLGLSQYYRWVDRDPRVLKAMQQQAQSIVDQVGPAPKVDITTLGWSQNKIESSSLLEPMMRVYFLTGDRQYLDFASYIIGRGGCSGSDLFQQAYDGVRPRLMGNVYPKAYEMLSVFEGLAEYYRATGEERWLRCLMNMYRGVCEREITIIGNAGCNQPYFPQWAGEAWGDTRFEQTNPGQTRMMETCVGVTWMKFCSQLLRLTGQAGMVDMIERYVYNGLLGAMKPEGDGFSYVNLMNGEKVTNSGWGWNFNGLPVTCCNLNGPMGLAYIPFVLAMQAQDGPVLNLYNSARIQACTASGKPVEVEVQTQFPLNGTVQITVRPQAEEKFALHLRIPGWSKNTACSINGRRVSGVKSGQYLVLKRLWKEGDRVSLQLDMRGQLLNAPLGTDRRGDHYQAVTYGPIVLARDEHLDKNYDKPVSILADTRHEVELQAVSPSLPGTRMEFLVPTARGPIHMTDYASVNGWDGKKVCTWLPMER